MNHDDPRLKHLLMYFSKNSDAFAGEVEILPPSPSELRLLLEITSDVPLVDVYPVPSSAVGRLSMETGHSPDAERYDYYFQTVVRSEFIATYNATTKPPYPAPESLPAFPEALPVRAKTDVDS